MNWNEIFGTNATSIVEVFIRGSITYLAIFALLRVSRRVSGEFNTSDLIVVVVVADAAQNAMAGSYMSVPEGIALVATIVGWSLAMDVAAYRFPRVRRLFEPAPVTLVRDGVPLRQNLRRNLLTLDDLRAQLRENGIEAIARVKRATLEPDGAISVIPLGDEPGGHPHPDERRD
jgi:uncharacterized membrane protein YcaP (DUF421 family)